MTFAKYKKCSTIPSQVEIPKQLKNHLSCLACSCQGGSADGQLDDEDGEDVDVAGDGGGHGDEHGVQLVPGVEHARLVVRQGGDELRAGVCA